MTSDGERAHTFLNLIPADVLCKHALQAPGWQMRNIYPREPVYTGSRRCSHSFDEVLDIKCITNMDNVFDCAIISMVKPHINSLMVHAERVSLQARLQHRIDLVDCIL